MYRADNEWTAGKETSSGARKKSFADVRKWVVRGGFSILDQGLFAGANFILNILLARWMSPAEYGAFALAYSIFLLLGTFHTAILTEPMLVFGAGKYEGRFRRYLGILISGHAVLMVPIASILFAASFLLGALYSPDVQRALQGLAAAGPVILLLWLLRRAFYVKLQPGVAVIGAGGYFLLLLGSTYVLKTCNWLNQFSAFLGMGTSALFVCIFFLFRLHPALFPSGSLKSMRVISDHWIYGRWAMGSAFFSWLPENFYFLVLPSFIGLQAVAVYRVLLNITMPILHSIGALSLLLTPLLSRQRRDNILGMKRTMRLYFVLFFSGAAAYFLLLVLFSGEITQFLYGENYSGLSSLVPLVGTVPFLYSMTAVLGSALRALEKPDKIFWGQTASSIFTVTVGMTLAVFFGVQGVLYGLLASLSVMIVILKYHFSAHFSRVAKASSL